MLHYMLQLNKNANNKLQNNLKISQLKKKMQMRVNLLEDIDAFFNDLN